VTERASSSLPAGYVRLSRPEGTVVVVAEHCAEGIQEVLDSETTLYEFAAKQTLAHPLAGRGVVWAVTLPGDCGEVVVRRNRHGGALAGVLGDLFLAHGRAPHELATSLRLIELGIPTPPLVAYASYPAIPLMTRADVLTRRIGRAQDLAELLTAREDAASKAQIFCAVSDLLVAMGRHGVHHPDLNLKNILLERVDSGWRALLLDVDRVHFGRPEAPSVTTANLARLARSAAKWRDRWGVPLPGHVMQKLSHDVVERLAYT